MPREHMQLGTLKHLKQLFLISSCIYLGSAFPPPPIISLSLSLYYDIFATTAHETVGPTNLQLSAFFNVTSLLQTTLDGNNLQALGMLKLLAGAFCVAYRSRNTDAVLLNKPGHAINLGVTALCSGLHVNKECNQLASQAARRQQQMLANGKHTPVPT